MIVVVASFEPVPVALLEFVVVVELFVPACEIVGPRGK